MGDPIKLTSVEAAIVIADKVVPEYRAGEKSYPCHGHIAKRWQAAYDGAFMALEDTDT